MSARYLEIDVVEPFDLGLDTNGLAQCALLINVVKTPSSGNGEFIEEIIELLEAASVGNATDILSSSVATLPDIDDVDPYLVIVEIPGAPPMRTHNETVVAGGSGKPAYPRPAARLTVRSRDYITARTMARAAYDALVGVRNTVVTVP